MSLAMQSMPMNDIPYTVCVVQSWVYKSVYSSVYTELEYYVAETVSSELLAYCCVKCF